MLRPACLTAYCRGPHRVEIAVIVALTPISPRDPKTGKGENQRVTIDN